LLPPHGDPFVYCKTKRLPLSVKFDDCCLNPHVSRAFQGISALSPLTPENTSYPQTRKRH
jgi:hypothetical protein